MNRHELDAFVVPSEDPHQSEYPPKRFRCRAFLTGFHGSAGTAIVTADRAGLWVDGRYHLEAENAVQGTCLEVFKMGLPGVPTPARWLAEVLPESGRVGIDGRVVSITQRDRWAESWKTKGLQLVTTDDPFDELWQDRPNLPAEPIIIHDIQYAGESAGARLEQVRSVMERHHAGAHVIATLDDIAYVLNLRGRDVPYNPVFVAFLVVLRENCLLFSDALHFDSTVREHLQNLNTELRPYDDFFPYVQSLTGRVLLDPARTSVSIWNALPDGTNPVPMTQPSTEHKGRKNPTELSNLRQVMARDGVYMVRFLMWLQSEFGAGHEVTELMASRKLSEIRAKDERYVSDSFAYISSTGIHGAIIHYSVDETTDIPLKEPGVYFIDSGGQYLDGTTDITRTVAIGQPPHQAIADFTLVLKSHIAMAEARFPTATPGRMLDAIARKPMWDEGRNYEHGTGHGVGFFLNVHEGPARVSPKESDWPLEVGTVLSNEPGIYRNGEYGIRIENLVAVQPEMSTQFGAFLRFETLTLCPIDLSLVDPHMLTDGERHWLNRYHEYVYRILSGLLTCEEQEWLSRATRRV